MRGLEAGELGAASHMRCMKHIVIRFDGRLGYGMIWGGKQSRHTPLSEKW